MGKVLLRMGLDSLRIPNTEILRAGRRVVLFAFASPGLGAYFVECFVCMHSLGDGSASFTAESRGGDVRVVVCSIL